MNRDDITRMAREAGFATEEWGDGFHVCVFNFQSSETDVTNELARFAALVAAAERDAILQMSNEQWFKTQADFETAIRARGQQ